MLLGQRTVALGPGGYSPPNRALIVPQGQWRLNRAHPLADQIAFLWFEGGGNRHFNLVDYRVGVADSSSYPITTLQGMGRYSPASANAGVDWGVYQPLLLSGDFTFAVLANPVKGPASGTYGQTLLIQRVDSGGSFKQVGLRANTNSAGNYGAGHISINAYTGGGVQNAYTANTFLTSTTQEPFRVIVGRRSGSTYSIWADGLDVTSGSSGGSTNLYHASQKFAIGKLADHAGANDSVATVVWGAAWNKALTDGEIGYLGREIWNLRQPLLVMPYVKAPAAGGASNAPRYYHRTQMGMS